MERAKPVKYSGPVNPVSEIAKGAAVRTAEKTGWRRENTMRSAIFSVWFFLIALFVGALLLTDRCFAGPLERAADYLVSNQLADGSWGESGLAGECVIGLCGAYEITGNSDYKSAAEAAGDFILQDAGYKPTDGTFAVPLYAAEAHALAWLSSIHSNPSNNPWRVALQDFFDNVRSRSGTTAAFIDDIVSGYGSSNLGSALYDIARFAAAAVYVGDPDVGVWRTKIIDNLGDLDDGDARPVTGLGAAVAALAATPGGLDGTTLSGSSTTLSGKTLSELPGFIASLQTFPGDFPWNFDGSYPGYLEPSVVAALALIAASDQRSAAASAASRLAGGVSAGGACYEVIGDSTSAEYRYYAGETLEVLAAAWDILCCEAADADRSGACDPPVDLVYIYRALGDFAQVAPPQWRDWDPDIPGDEGLRQRISDHRSCYDIDRDGSSDSVDLVYLYRGLQDFSAVAPPEWRPGDPSIPPDPVLRSRAEALCTCASAPAKAGQEETGGKSHATVALWWREGEGPGREAELVIGNEQPLTFVRIVVAYDAASWEALGLQLTERVAGGSDDGATGLYSDRCILSLWNPTGSVVLEPGSGPVAVLRFEALSAEAAPEGVALVGGSMRQGTQEVAALIRTSVPFVRGDANQDMSLDLADAVTVLRYLFAGHRLSCEASADANADGRLDVADPVRLLSYLFAGGAAPPAPFPGCGVPSGSAEGLSCERSACR